MYVCVFLSHTHTGELVWQPDQAPDLETSPASPKGGGKWWALGWGSMGFELRISEIWRVKLNEDQKPKIYGVFLKSEIYGIENGAEDMSENRIVLFDQDEQREAHDFKSVLGLGWRWARRFNYGNASSSGIKFHPPVTFYTSKCI